MDKNVHIISGFIDLGTVKIGERMAFLQDGQWHQTSPIVKTQIAGNNVRVETQNSIYANYDITQDIEYQYPTLEHALAERCLDTDKHAKIIDSFDVDRLIKVKQDGSCWYVEPSDIKAGDHIQLNCCCFDLDSGAITNGLIDIPSVQDFAYEDGKLIIESRSSIFSNIDFSKEYAEMKMERALEQQISFGER